MSGRVMSVLSTVITSLFLANICCSVITIETLKKRPLHLIDLATEQNKIFKYPTDLLLLKQKIKAIIRGTIHRMIEADEIMTLRGTDM